jgi:excisionase family DNA binding protein
MTVDFVGIGEAAQILGLSRTSIQKLVDSGQLPAVKTTGGHRRILRGSIEELNQKMGPKAMMRLAGSHPLGQSPSPPVTDQEHVQILIAEDDEASATALVGMLEIHFPDVKCIVASDGLDAVLQLERIRPTILISDLMMEPFDGFRLINMVTSRAEYNRVALLVFSSMSDADIQARGGLPPNVLFMRKPVSMERLRGYVDAHVQIHRQRRAAARAGLSAS